jgi:hypothetical protein
MTEEDTLFIEEVRDSLANPEPEEPVSAPPLRREASIAGRRTTADAKLDMLRQRLREREGALARMTDLLKAKERESPRLERTARRKRRRDPVAEDDRRRDLFDQRVAPR